MKKKDQSESNTQLVMYYYVLDTECMFKIAKFHSIWVLLDLGLKKRVCYNISIGSLFCVELC